MCEDKNEEKKNSVRGLNGTERESVPHDVMRLNSFDVDVAGVVVHGKTKLVVVFCCNANTNCTERGSGSCSVFVSMQFLRNTQQLAYFPSFRMYFV